MNKVKTSRPFQERFLDGYDRSELRREVEKVRPRRLSGLRRKYAGWALGASLALGGIGIPLKMSNLLQSAESNNHTRADPAPEQSLPVPPDTGAQIANDLTTAKQIADQVAGGITGGVTGAVQDVATTVGSTPSQVAQAPSTIASVAEQVRQRFFQKNDLPPELLAAVVHTESKFVPTAHSNRGAIGLMQLVPSTGHWLGTDNLTDPAENIQAGAKYLRYLTDRFAGDQQKAIAAYNAGEGNVRRFNGVPPFRETRNYIQRVRSFQQDLGARADSQSDAAGAAQ
jgi:hypothetical protein